jgi:putative oxidoreductase
MYRVSSTFEDHLPSHGLLLLRLIVATALIARCVQLVNGASLQTFTLLVIAAGAGLLLLLGLWTPVAGVILAISEILIAFSQGHDPWASVLLGSLGVAVALLGPGTWSLDARRSGWKRIEIRPRDK